MGKCDLGSILPRRLLRGSRKLRRLYLWGNRIKTFPPNFFSDSRSLSELVLSGNSISNLDELTFGGIDQFKNLKLLDLDKNSITSLQGIKSRDRFKQNSEFSGHSFSMSFDGKEEAPLSRVIGNKLETLKLGGNNIHTLPGGFLSDLKYLKFLKLDNNGLSYVYPGAFDGLQSMVRLSLAWNMIGYLPDDIFAQMSHLLILELQGNRLEHLWFRTFRGLSSLQSLDLSKNRLSALAEGLFQHSPSLIRIDLSHNQLQFLDECSFHRPIHRLQSVSLVDNPIVCSCTLSWLWRYTGSAVRHQDQSANSTMGTIRSTDRLQIRPSFREDSGLQHRRRRHLRHLHNHHHHHRRRHRRHRLHHQRNRRKKKRQSDYIFPSNYTDFTDEYDQISTDDDDDFIVDAKEGLPEIPEHMKPLRHLLTWGSCTLVSMETHQQQQHQQQQQHRGTKSTTSSSNLARDSKQLPISSFQVRLMLNCSVEKCDDEF